MWSMEITHTVIHVFSMIKNVRYSLLLNIKSMDVILFLRSGTLPTNSFLSAEDMSNKLLVHWI